MGNAFKSLFNGDQGIPQTRDRLPWREFLQATPSPPGACLARWSKMDNIMNQYLPDGHFNDDDYDDEDDEDRWKLRWLERQS